MIERGKFIYSGKMQIGLFRTRYLDLLYEICYHFRSLFVLLFQGYEVRYVYWHFRETGVELSAATSYDVAVQADGFTFPYLLQPLEEATANFVCFAFLFIGVPEGDGKFGTFTKCFPIISHKSMYIHDNRVLVWK